MSGNLLVIGAVNVDLVARASRLPGPGETVVGADLQRHGGGKGANSAVAAARAGAEVRYVGAVGADDFGAGALADLRAEGIDLTDVVVDADVATGTALIVVDDRGENQIAVSPGANAVVSPAMVRGAVERARGWAGCVLVSTEIPVPAVAAAVSTATDLGIPCILNPAPVDPGLLPLLPLSPVLTPNRSELHDLHRLAVGSGASSSADLALEERALEERALEVGARSKAPVVVTLGGEGVLICEPDGSVDRVPAGTARAVVDTTGAGDTFNGVFAAALSSGSTVSEATRRGVAAATLSVEAAGARTSMPAADVIDAAMTSSARA